jgi:hypothetical protein
MEQEHSIPFSGVSVPHAYKGQSMEIPFELKSIHLVRDLNVTDSAKDGESDGER